MLYDSSHFPEFCGLHPFPPFVNQKKKIPLKDECAILGKKKSVGKDFLTIWNLYTNKVALFFKRSTWNAIFYPLKKKKSPQKSPEFCFSGMFFLSTCAGLFFPPGCGLQVREHWIRIWGTLSEWNLHHSCICALRQTFHLYGPLHLLARI